MNITLSKQQIASIKRTAQNLASSYRKIDAINAAIAKKEEEKKALEEYILQWETPIMNMTGGKTTKELIKTEKITDAKGNISTRYIFVESAEETEVSETENITETSVEPAVSVESVDELSI